VCCSRETGAPFLWASTRKVTKKLEEPQGFTGTGSPRKRFSQWAGKTIHGETYDQPEQPVWPEESAGPAPPAAAEARPAVGAATAPAGPAGPGQSKWAVRPAGQR